MHARVHARKEQSDLGVFLNYLMWGVLSLLSVKLEIKKRDSHEDAGTHSEGGSCAFIAQESFSSLYAPSSQEEQNLADSNNCNSSCENPAFVKIKPRLLCCIVVKDQTNKQKRNQKPINQNQLPKPKPENT